MITRSSRLCFPASHDLDLGSDDRRLPVQIDPGSIGDRPQVPESQIRGVESAAAGGRNVKQIFRAVRQEKVSS